MAGKARVRSQSTYHDYGTGSWGSDYSPTQNYSSYLVKRKTTTDEIKHGWRTNPRPTWDAGGPFESTHYTGTFQPFYGRTYGNLFDHRKFQGPVMPSHVISDANDASFRSSLSHWADGHALFYNAHRSNAGLDALGTTAISACAPTNPHAGVYNMLGELRRDGLPAISGVRAFKDRGKPTALSDEYLNYEFGIKPLLSDLMKLREAAQNAKSILEQYQRDAGRLVRRRYSFPLETSSETSTAANFNLWPSLDSYYWDSTTCATTRKITVQTERWFSGAFMYRLPDLEGPLKSIVNTIAEMNHLFGISPTPIALWNLTPWTWAADWFSNLGDVINNASMMMSDGLLLHHGYVMESITMTVENFSTGPRLKGGGTIGCSRTLKITSKRRRRATPFGFGLNEDGLSLRQKAIIAALGLSQGGRYVAK